MKQQTNKPHLSVMPREFLEHFEDSVLTTFFEGTLGAGGHARLILEAHPEIETYIACDKDPVALEIAAKELAPWKKKLRLIEGNFADLDQILTSEGIKEVDGFFLTWEFPRCS